MINEAVQEYDLGELREKARSSLYFFTKGILGYDWLVPHIHGGLCRELEDFTNNRKGIILPRGWLKSTICSIAYPMWLSIRNPEIRVLLVQNSSTNACKKLSVVRSQWEQNDLLRSMYPELLPGKSNVWKADALCLTRKKSLPEATYEAAGTSTRVVSRHYEVIIEDDTVAPDYDELGQESLAPTHEDVEKAIGWHRTNVLPLMNNPDKDISLVVGTRWYDQDLLRWIMDNEPQYKFVTRACRENEEGKPDYKGVVTYPERFGEKTLKELENALGSYMFGCLYMNTPIRSEDMAFKPQWFTYYDTPPVASKMAIYTTVDPATDPKLSKSGSTDYSVVMTCGKDLVTGHVYVLDYFHKQCNPGELAEAIFQHVARWKPIIVGYEDVAYQRSIEYWLKEMMRQENLFFILEPLNLSRGRNAKEHRISGLQPLFQSGTVLLKTHMKELVSELLKFPLGAHDDLADALSMQTVLWRATRSDREYKKLETYDPFSYDSMVEELKGRQKRPNLLLQPSQISSNIMTFLGR